MQFTIRNNEVTATINSLAAEVISFKRNSDDKEMVWCRNPEFWYNCNPILFPIVGPLVNNTYTYKGKDYTLTQHGFARRSEFTFEEVKKDSVRLSLSANEETLKVYPFNFKLTVSYSLEGSKLNLAYKIENLSDEDLPFNIGFHPAFSCPNFENEEYQKYYIQFENPEMINGVKTDKMYLKDVINTETAQIFFYNNAVSSNYVVLTTGEGGIKISKENYTVLGFWRKMPTAPFVCIEPQYPANDLPQANTFRSDSTNNLLPPNKSFECKYYWELL